MAKIEWLLAPASVALCAAMLLGWYNSPVMLYAAVGMLLIAVTSTILSISAFARLRSTPDKSEIGEPRRDWSEADAQPVRSAYLPLGGVGSRAPAMATVPSPQYRTI